MKIGFLGAGNLPSAIIEGLIKSGIKADIFVNDIDAGIMKAFEEKCIGSFDLNNMSELDMCVVAVKPHILPSVLPMLKSSDKKPRMFVSVVAGFSIEQLGFDYPLARVLPNLNAKVCASASCYCVNERCTQEHIDILNNVFGAVGELMPLDENLFGITFALAGSTPAFTYLFIDALANAAVKMGMNKKTALTLSAQAVLGSALTVKAGSHPQVSVEAVCSPKGMTIEGVHVLKEGGFEGMVMSALEAAILKEKSLSGGLNASQNKQEK